MTETTGRGTLPIKKGQQDASRRLARLLILVLGVPGFAGGAGRLPALSAAAPERPNIVLIVADDLGAADPGYAGSTFHETPRLDRLAAQSVIFRQAYSACTVCSPTRAALQTGKHPARLKLTDWIPGHSFPAAKLRPPEWTKELPLEEVTVAERLREKGYATYHIGKWHLGGAGHGPLEQGFDVNLGGDHRGQPPSYFSPHGLPQLPDGPAGEYLTDREASEARTLIRSAGTRPFFLSLGFHAVHTPLQAKEALLEKYRQKSPGATGQRNPVYAAMLESLDAAVGVVLDALEESGVTDRTLVLFTSDNGGLVLGDLPPTSNAPLRSGKGSPYEGGVRVPLLIRWPRLGGGGRTCEVPVVSMDLAATILDLAGALPPNGGLDGTSLLSLLEDPARDPGRALLAWHYPHYHPGGSTPHASARAGDWKLIQHYEDGRHELFNLRVDPSEQDDRAATEPERVLELARKLLDWQGSVGAQWPMQNPAHVPQPLVQAADGSFELHARDAMVHGTTLRYEPQPFKNTLGWWGRAEDFASWAFKVERPGDFDVEILQGCGRGHGGSTVAIEVGDQRIEFVVEETGHFQSFLRRIVGRVTLAPSSSASLIVRPLKKPGGAVMDLRRVRLIPAETAPAPPPGIRPFLESKRVVLLGDSITYAGEWAELVETYLHLSSPRAETTFLNLGLPSETLSGLSEPGHAGGSFPRPDLHERLERLLDRAKPDLIVACYGMNDGIYHPFDDVRFQRFQDGVVRLREAAARRGVRVIHLTPPVFDPEPIRGNTLPAGRAEYRSPYVGYDDVLARYSSWLLERRTAGWEVVDIHGPMSRFLSERRSKEPGFLLASDGVHAGSQGHWILAREVLRFLGAPDDVTSADQPAFLGEPGSRARRVLDATAARQRVLKDSWLTHVGHLRPGMARGKPLEDAEGEARKLTEEIQRALR